MAAAQTIGPAQTAVDTNPGKVSLVATYDFTNAYTFRGLLQNDLHMTPDGLKNGVWMFPFAEARFDLHDDDDGVTDVALRIGSWNGLSTGGAGTAGPSGKLWYESSFYSAVDVTSDRVTPLAAAIRPIRAEQFVQTREGTLLRAQRTNATRPAGTGAAPACAGRARIRHRAWLRAGGRQE